MNYYVCTNCGLWQRQFEKPTSCPICLDFRHTPPEDAPFEFWSFGEAQDRIECLWQQSGDGIWEFWNEPHLGIGPHGYLLEHEDGNVFFENCPFYSLSALEFIAKKGGIKWLSASHPHAYAGLWQLQQTLILPHSVMFRPITAIQVEDLAWTNAFNTDYPFDQSLNLNDDMQLLHVGGHFAGQSILHWKSRSFLFAGDMIKFRFKGDQLLALSTHKGYNRRIPMSHGEIRKYRSVVEKLDFDHVYTTFENAPCNRDMVLRLFDAQLEGQPFFGPMAL